MRKKILLIVAGIALVATSLFTGSSPASASTCSPPATWNKPTGAAYPVTIVDTLHFGSNGTAGHKNACVIVGMTPGSNPNGNYSFQIKVQETVDLGDQANAWDDAGSTRIQLFPPGWGSWGESNNAAICGTCGFLAADANSADFAYNDGHGVWQSRTYNAAVNGSPYTWAWRVVEQGHYQSQVFVPWIWEDVPWIQFQMQ